MYTQNLKRIALSDGAVALDGPCAWCKKPQTITVSEASLSAYESGALAQKAFPFLAKDERELLISGNCKRCYEMFA